MPDTSNKLWPYSRTLAIAAIPMILLLSVLIISGIHFLFAWPDQVMNRWLMILVTIISFISLILVLLDFFASSSTVLDVCGIKIDFSNIVMANPEFKRQSIDSSSHSETQIQSVIDSKAPYMALVRHGVFDSMHTRQDGERLILKAWMEQSRIQNQM